jgi:hypothetical protein
MENASVTERGEDGGFCSLLHSVLDGCEPIDAHFREPVSRKKPSLLLCVRNGFPGRPTQT